MTDASAKPLSPGLVARVAAGLRYIVGGEPPDWFGPLDPMPPMAPPDIAGRSFDFPVGVNLRIQPRPDEPTSFAELRALADRYDLIRLVIETRKDQLGKFDWSIRKRAGRGDIDGDGDPRIDAVEELLRYPDREHDFGTWLRLLLEDLLVIDAPTLYLRRDAAGGLYALEVVDGATIKRVIDERGRTPLPPSPAYQQILKGMPAIDYTTDELIYRPRNPRPHKIYGLSPVEQVVMTVNIALRRQVAQLQYYTEGNVPEAMIGVPESWSPDQIRQFQDYWDALLEGNTAARRHAKFVPGGMRPTFTREPVLKDDYDEWLARVVCFAFSVAPTPFVRDSNRATAQTTQQAALAEGLSPLLRWVKGLLDEVIHRHLGYTDLEFAWADGKDQDPAERARIDDTYVRAGIKSVDEVRAELGLDAVGFGNAIYTGQGAVPLGEVGAQAAAPATAKRALAKYSPDQPRVPAGGSGGGQWTSGGAGDGGGVMLAAADNVGTVTDAAVDAPSGDATTKDPPKQRHLTQGEIDLARSVFGDRINYDNVTIHHQGYPLALGMQQDDTTMSPDGNIYFTEKSPAYREDFGNGSVEDQAHFIHEMTHVLQSNEHLDPGMGHVAKPDYSYDLNSLNENGQPLPLQGFGVEQQAQIVEDYFRLTHGRQPRFVDQKAFPISDYRRVLGIGANGTVGAAVAPQALPEEKGSQ